MDEGTIYYKAFLSGDELALEKLIEMYKDGLILYLESYTHNIYWAEELTEETFVKLVVKRPHFFERSSFKTFLYSIARHVALDTLRHASKFKEIPLTSYENMIEDQMNLEKEYLMNEKKIEVHQALNQLNQDYRQVIYLSYFEDFSNEQMARILKKNKRQIENMLYFAKKALKSELEKRGFNHEDF